MEREGTLCRSVFDLLQLQNEEVREGWAGARSNCGWMRPRGVFVRVWLATSDRQLGDTDWEVGPMPATTAI